MLDVLFFAALAIFLIFKLKSILGEDYGDDNFAAKQKKDGSKVVIDITTRATKHENQKLEEDAQRAKESAITRLLPKNFHQNPESLISADLSNSIELLAKIPNFDPKVFIAGCCEIFYAVIDSYQKGNLGLVEMVLSNELRTQLNKATEERRSLNITESVIIVSINHASIVAIEGQSDRVSLKVKFISEQVSYSQNSEGVLIGGDKDKIFAASEIWNFSAALDKNNSEPEWKLCGIENCKED